MMRLFEMNDNFELQLNKEWIMMIPEFAELVRRDRGSVGDSQGRRKLRAIRELSFVYLIQDFHSPYRELNDYDRRITALKECGLTEADIDEEVEAALEKYRYLLLTNAPMLETLEVVRSSREKLNAYFRDLDLTLTNMRGEPIFSSSTFIKNIRDLPAMESAIEEYEQFVYKALKGTGGVRGGHKTGYNEKRNRELKESDRLAGEDSGPTFGEIPTVKS